MRTIIKISESTHTLLSKIGFKQESWKVLDEYFSYLTNTTTYTISLQNNRLTMTKYSHDFSNREYKEFITEDDLIIYLNKEFKSSIRKNKIQKLLYELQKLF